MAQFAAGGSKVAKPRDPRDLLVRCSEQTAAEKIMLTKPDNDYRLCSLWSMIRGNTTYTDCSEIQSNGLDNQLRRAMAIVEILSGFGFLDAVSEANKTQRTAAQNLQFMLDKVLEGSGQGFNTEIIVRVLLQLFCSQIFPHAAVSVFPVTEQIIIRRPEGFRRYCAEQLQELGAGSFGKVFLFDCVNAVHFPGTPDAVAIKMIDTALLASHEKDLANFAFEGRLKREIQNLCYVQHTNIVRFIDYFSVEPKSGRPVNASVANLYHGSKLFVVMELCPSELFDVIANGTLSEPEARAALSQIGRALLYLHNCKIAHRDVKPENIGYYKDGATGEVVCKLFDFGMSKRIGDTPSQKGHTAGLGTVNYRAPELGVQGAVHDFKVDT